MKLHKFLSLDLYECNYLLKEIIFWRCLSSSLSFLCTEMVNIIILIGDRSTSPAYINNFCSFVSLGYCELISKSWRN